MPSIEEDELFDQAVRIVLETKQPFVTTLQRRLKIGYAHSARLINAMEKQGIVGPLPVCPSRELLMTLGEWNTKCNK